MKTQKEIENLAKEYANIPLHKNIDEEERYFQGHACKVYDAFIAGYKAANQPDTSLLKFQQFIEEKIMSSLTDDSILNYILCKQMILDFYNT